MLTIGLGALLLRVPAFREGRDGRSEGVDPAHALAQLATYVLVPVLLFRTMARMDLSHMPWPVVQAYFVPVLTCALLVYALNRRERQRLGGAAPGGAGIERAQVRESSLRCIKHLIREGVHGEAARPSISCSTTPPPSLSHAHSPHPHVHAGFFERPENSTLIHPVVLPVLLGLAVNLSGVSLPGIADQLLIGLGVAAVPLCLLLIGMNDLFPITERRNGALRPARRDPRRPRQGADADPGHGRAEPARRRGGLRPGAQGRVVR